MDEWDIKNKPLREGETMKRRQEIQDQHGDRIQEEEAYRQRLRNALAVGVGVGVGIGMASRQCLFTRIGAGLAKVGGGMMRVGGCVFGLFYIDWSEPIA